MNHSAQHAADLSALMDGELGEQDTAVLVKAVAQDAQLQAAWQHYHLISEALRAGDGVSYRAMGQGSLQSSLGAEARVMPMTPISTQQSPLHLASHSTANSAPVSSTHSSPYSLAANDSVWRWKLAAGFAAVAAVGSIVWAVAGQGGSATQNLASNSSSAMATTALLPVELTTGQQGTMIRDPRLDELMAAHKQFGSASALQPAGFLRSASFQAAQR